MPLTVNIQPDNQQPLKFRTEHYDREPGAGGFAIVEITGPGFRVNVFLDDRDQADGLVQAALTARELLRGEQ